MILDLLYNNLNNKNKGLIKIKIILKIKIIENKGLINS